MAKATNDKDLQRDAPDEISKKDLLQETGISYGQFYRWKRMGLIPEAWFRRRSTFTGQETFLPRQKLLERIRRIHDLKDRYSLENIAVMLSPDVAVRSYPSAEVGKMEWISQRAHTLFVRHRDGEDYSFLDLVALRLIERLLAQDVLSDDQIGLAVETLQERFDALGDASVERRLTVTMHSGLTGVALHTGVCLFNSHQEVVSSMDLNQLIEQLKVFLPQTRE